MSISFHPKINELARSREVAELIDSAYTENWIISGLDLSVPVSGLDVLISSGKAYINGYIVNVDNETITVIDDDTSIIYLGVNVDGSNNATSCTFSLSIPSSGKYIILGQVVAVSGDITAVNDTGRSIEQRVSGSGGANVLEVQVFS